MKLVLQIAAGVLLGMLLFWAIQTTVVDAYLEHFFETTPPLVTTPPITLPKLQFPSVVNPSEKGTIPYVLDRSYNAVPPDRIKTIQPPGKTYREVKVPGKPLDECMGPESEVNEQVLRCTQGYTTRVPIYD